ncbi:hypothetical protein B0J17DRAFT_722836 [Rhizoctonia solani]|nr:hypothetical protein B0J17DRAFT_722836 [Rhizoctonia solani]
MSGWHLVAVSVNGSEVRHSPVLALHDGKELKDGALLLMHLLSPTFTRLKAPWLAPLPSHPHGSHPILPDEVICQIVHFTDFETHLGLPSVSRPLRSICLAHPRVRNHILLGYEGTSPSLKPVFRIRSTASTDSKLAALKRVKATMPDPENVAPRWQYRS